jgi:predicted MFS family arabinose efflux permease
MLSHAGKRIGGYGWVFGIHEALDQFGAMIGPLVVAIILLRAGTYHQAFAVLVIPAVINLSLVLVAQRLYPRPEDLDISPSTDASATLPRAYWLYLAAAALAAAGFADYPIIAYHFSQSDIVSRDWIPAFYAVAMAVSGTGSLVLGRLYDRFGFSSLIAITVVSALFAPLVFLGGFWISLIGAAVWGLGIGAHESIIPAAVSPMVSPKRRAYAFGLFTAGYGVFWFLGSAAIGILYDLSLTATICFCVIVELAAVPVLILVRRERETT